MAPTPPPDSSPSPPPAAASLSSPPTPSVKLDDEAPPTESSASPPPTPPLSPPPTSSPPPTTSASPPPTPAKPASPPPASSTPPAASSPPPATISPPAPVASSPPPPVAKTAPTPKGSPSPPPSPPQAQAPPTALSPPNNVPPSPQSSSSSSSPPPPHSSNALSPPPPTQQKTPSSSSSPPPPPSSSSSSSDSSLPIIIGVAAGAGLLLIVVIALIFSCTRKKKKKSAPDQIQYYSNNSPLGPKGGEYYNNNGYNNHYKPGDQHIVKIPPPPGAQHGSWPPPPPMMVNSSTDEFSSNSGAQHHHSPLPPPPHPNLALGFNKNSFTYDELAIATGGFTQANLLGQGGFGYVHKGVLPNGKEVAVKSLKAGSGQGEREFQAEVEIISRVHHRHLVSLVGYCIAGGQRMLVYEFVPNNTLEFHLHGKGRPTMEWSTRLKIALGSARGLAYLHEDCHPRIIHRDIKTANILLDYNNEAMVADFGLAKLSSDNFTHVSTRIMGTFGYLAPEYASSGKLTDKSDVFSYGVMLLELITGRRPVDPSSDLEDSLVDWARPIMTHGLEDGNFGELVDQKLENNYNVQEMTAMVACAASCIRHSARRRPKMSQIVRALEGDVLLEDLNEGVKPGSSSVFSSGSESSQYDTNLYNADMKKFRKMALQSGEYQSSEFGATSEYGLNPSSSSSSSNNNSREMPKSTGTRGSQLF